MGYWGAPVMDWALAILGLTGVALLGYALFVEPDHLQVHTVRVAVQLLPPSLEGVRIAQLSDVHGRHRVGGRSLESWVSDLEPDFVVVTGDLLGPSSDAGPLLAMLGRLAELWPVYYVTGNHEHLLDLPGARRRARREGAAGKRYNSLASFLDALRDQGVRVLANRSEVLSPGRFHTEARLTVTGVLDPARHHDRLAKALGSVPTARRPHPVVLLAHSPDIAPEACANGVDLVVAGHTHGGQVCLPGFGALVTPTRLGRAFASGLHPVGGTQVYVSRGIGTTGLPLRFACPPELVLLELHRG